MMQSGCRRREHGSSSGELAVFGATSYFAGCLPAPDDRRPSSATTEPSSADRLYFQAKVVQHDTTRMTTEEKSFHSPHQQQQQQQLAGLHDHAAERYATDKQLLQVVGAKQRQPYSGKSKLAALLSFMASPSPSPRTSFRKEINKEDPSATSKLRQAAEAASAAEGGEKESSIQLQGLFGAHDDDDDELDLGVATGDRRLQGITVVRAGGGGGEERWVVRCVPGGACWDWDDEEHREKMLVDAPESSASSEQQNIKDEQLVEVEQLQGDDDDDDADGNIDPAQSWDSDSSSDLFDLDLEYR